MKASKSSPGPRTLPTPTTLAAAAPPPDPASPRSAVVTPMLAPAVEPDDLGVGCGNGAEERDEAEAAAFAAEAEEAALQADQRLEEMDAMEPPGEDEDGVEEDATEKEDNEEVAGEEEVEE